VPSAAGDGIQVGLVVPQQEIGNDPALIAHWARAAQASGFAYLDIFDHVLGADVSERPGWTGVYTRHHAFHEPFVLLAFLAGQVDLELATGVLVLPQRQTALVAKQATTLDVISRGRLRLGVGIGWNHVEYEALGSTFDDRAARYDEQIELLRRLWAEPVVTFDGAYHRVDGAGIEPRPARGSISLWLGGGTAPAVLRRVGRLGDGWIVHDPHPGQAVTNAWKVITTAAEAADRDPASIGLQGRIDIHGPLDPDRLVRSLDRWRDVGATHVSLHATHQGDARAHIDLIPTLAELAGLQPSPPSPPAVGAL
jgi:probable F420-dependent oxidoreductase